MVTQECVLLYSINLRRLGTPEKARLMTRRMSIITDIMDVYFRYRDKEYQVPQSHNN